MRSTIAQVLVLSVILGLSIAAAQQAAMTMTELLRTDLSAPGREVVQILAVLPAGGASGGRHTHPGEEVLYVIEGTIRIEVDGEPAVIRKAGESFVAPAGKVHFASNEGTATARALATYIVEKGKPRTTFVR